MKSYRKTIFIVLSCFLIVMLYFCDSQAGLFKNTVPTGKEIKYPYLEQLFAPEFPYESVKGIETKEGKRYVIIKAKETIADEVQNNYEKDTLFKRKIVIYRLINTKDSTLLVSKMIIHRTVSEMPFVVEYSEIKGERLSGNRVEDVLRHEGQYLIIHVNKDFGKVFRKVIVYPERDVPCPTPPFVGKYPDSKSIACYEDDKLLSFVFVAKAKTEDIYDYYKEILKEHYKQIGFNAPESAWKIQDLRLPQFGIKISTVELYKWGSFLDFMKIVMKQDVTQTYYHGPELKRLSKDSPVSENGLVFNIEIEKGDRTIPDYCLIKVHYSIDTNAIKRDIEEMKKRYPEGIE